MTALLIAHCPELRSESGSITAGQRGRLLARAREVFVVAKDEDTSSAGNQLGMVLGISLAWGVVSSLWMSRRTGSVYP